MKRSMRKLINSLLFVLCLLSCEKSAMTEGDAGLKEVRIAVVLPQQDREAIWDNVLKMAQENVRKAGIGAKVVYEWYDEQTSDLTRLGRTLSEREDISSLIGCNISANTQTLAYALARKKSGTKPLFTFCTSQELPRIFGKRGFLWGLCETDISQSEILLSCLANEYDHIEKVALLASDDIYGQTFVDWFAFQALELDMDPVYIGTYSTQEELETCLAQVKKSGADAMVCVPYSVDDVVPIYNEIEYWNWFDEEFEGTMALMFSDKAYNSSILDPEEPVDFITGLAPSSDPGSGFSVSYEAVFGRLPFAGEAEVYDAVMITVLASLWAEKNGEDDLNKAISTLLNKTAQEQGGWTPGMLRNYYNQILSGQTPSISGATGMLDFDSEFYTTTCTTSYARWITHRGEMVVIDYFSRNTGTHSSSPVAAWEWNKTHVQDVGDVVQDLEYPELKENYAVLIAASHTWKNYRHQADVLGFYHYLKGRGYDDDHILLIMADDIAYNKENPLQGVVRREIDGENLYEDVVIDYKLGTLTLSDLRSILTEAPSEKFPVTLGATDNDNVFFFWSGHGSPEGWKWEETEILSPDSAREMFSDMSFRKMFAVVETCYSAVVGEGCEGIDGLLMMTAANAKEPSKADCFDDELGVYLSNTFTSSILSHFVADPDTAIYDLYLQAFDKTLGSHVTLCNAEHYGSLYLNDICEYFPDGGLIQ